MQSISIPPPLRRYWTLSVCVGAGLLCFVGGMVYGRARPLAPPYEEPAAISATTPPVANISQTARPASRDTPDSAVKMTDDSAVLSPPVSTTRVPPITSIPVAVASPDQTRLAVQIASLSDPNLANQHKQNFILQGLPAFVEPVIRSASDTRYRVLVGPFNKRTDADAALQRIRQDPRFSGSFVRPY